MATISLCMIVKNEEDSLRRCLSSIHMLMDEIIIVDTGSTDNTKEIALEYTQNIYDFPWNNDFAEARNFAFSKATMEYIYTADADEVIDFTNRTQFFELKNAMIPEIEIVQMYYVTSSEFNTTSNFQKEYRPKLYKRLRTFTWVDAVHETVRLDPVVYDSDIEIRHLPRGLHSKRDFSIYKLIYNRDGCLSPKLHSMYAKELFICGEEEDFMDAEDVFTDTLSSPTASRDALSEALCILAHIHRIRQHTDVFFSLAFKLIHESSCAEICYEVGCHFKQKADYREAINWLTKAAYETPAIIDARRCGSLPRYALAECYRLLAEEIKNTNPFPDELVQSALAAADVCEMEANEWELPMD